MATSLDAVRAKLLSRVRMLDSAFDRHVLTPTLSRRVDRFALQEGLVSGLWQSWCAFCRDTIIGSASGILSAGGQQVTSPYAGRSESEIAYVAKALSRGQQAPEIRPLQGLEPTWGDLDKINLMAGGISSTNQSQLLSAFGVALAIKDLQLCRNASAHVNPDMIGRINAAKVRYSETRYNHPSDLIVWLDPSTQDFLWKTWVEEMKVISEFAIT